ncbi:hypothetical protein F0562_012403 [Nyssa sinensis]|uniref:Uncharacterized protein n=1 Tax=Nyssa sinensis TaxID=561372 RepID=A0A5J4ZTN2_9ASTE|nr:hypothetical protein F0562_012403 [Nyssa sinensis]
MIVIGRIKIEHQKETVNPNPGTSVPNQNRRSGIFQSANSNRVYMELCQDEMMAENLKGFVFTTEGRSTAKERRAGKKRHMMKQNRTKGYMQKMEKTWCNEKNSTDDGNWTNSLQLSNRKKNVLKIGGTIEQNEEHRATYLLQDHNNVRDPNGQRRRSRDGEGMGM